MHFRGYFWYASKFANILLACKRNVCKYFENVILYTRSSPTLWVVAVKSWNFFHSFPCSKFSSEKALTTFPNKIESISFLQLLSPFDTKQLCLSGRVLRDSPAKDSSSDSSESSELSPEELEKMAAHLDKKEGDEFRAIYERLHSQNSTDDEKNIEDAVSLSANFAIFIIFWCILTWRILVSTHFFFENDQTIRRETFRLCSFFWIQPMQNVIFVCLNRHIWKLRVFCVEF